MDTLTDTVLRLRIYESSLKGINRIMNPGEDEDAIMQELGPYLNIEKTDREPIMPSSIQQYHRIVKSNNEGSIFDDIYNQAGPETVSNNSPRLENNSSVGLFDDAASIIRVQGGRRGGRGGRSSSSRITFVRAEPVQPSNGLEEDSDEKKIQRQLRKVCPDVHSNDVIKQSICEIQQTRSPNHGNTPNNANSSDNSMVSSSDDGWSGASSSATASESTGNGNAKTSPTLSPCATAFTSKSMPMTNGITNKIKPITEILELSRKQYKYEKSQQLELCCFDPEDENDTASKKKIKEILRQDAEEDLQRRMNDSAAQSLNPRRTNRTNFPSRRTNNNLRRNGHEESVNINSISDFPPLEK